MQPQRLPGPILTVVIRDDSPAIHLGDSPRYRSVRLRLTEEQRAMIGLRWTGKSGTADKFESVSKCFIEPEVPFDEHLPESEPKPAPAEACVYFAVPGDLKPDVRDFLFSLPRPRVRDDGTFPPPRVHVSNVGDFYVREVTTAPLGPKGPDPHTKIEFKLIKWFARMDSHDNGPARAAMIANDDTFSSSAPTDFDAAAHVVFHDFPFEELHAAMTRHDWRWYDGIAKAHRVPTVDQLKKTARELISHVERPRAHRSVMGGFVAKKEGGRISLEFPEVP